LLPAPRQAGADTVTETARGDLTRAEQLYHDDRLLEAERLYAQALANLPEEERQRCYDRLLTVYVRLGRPDQVIRLGAGYEPWLVKRKDLARLRELKIELGGAYLALGHSREAETLLEEALGGPRFEGELPPGPRLTVLLRLALAAERRDDQARATRRWKDVEALARSRLETQPPPGPQERIEVVRRLADSYRHQGRPAEAVPLVKELLPLHQDLE